MLAKRYHVAPDKLKNCDERDNDTKPDTRRELFKRFAGDELGEQLGEAYLAFERNGIKNKFALLLNGDGYHLHVMGPLNERSALHCFLEGVEQMEERYVLQGILFFVRVNVG